MNTVKVYGLPGFGKRGEVGDEGNSGANIYVASELLDEQGDKSILDYIDLDTTSKTIFKYNKVNSNTKISIIESDKLQIDDNGDDDIQLYDIILDTTKSLPKLYRIYDWVRDIEGVTTHTLIREEEPYSTIKINQTTESTFTTSYAYTDDIGTTAKVYINFETDYPEKYMLYYTVNNSNTANYLCQHLGDEIPSSISVNNINNGDTLLFYALYLINGLKYKTIFLGELVFKK